MKTATSAANKAANDPADDDMFVCDRCGGVFDIEDSIKPEGKKGPIVCPACAGTRFVVDHGSYGEEVRDTSTGAVVAECAYGEGLTDEQVAANAGKVASSLNNDWEGIARELADALDELMQSEGNEPRTDPGNSPNTGEWNRARKALRGWYDRNA